MQSRKQIHPVILKKVQDDDFFRMMSQARHDFLETSNDLKK